MYKSGFISIVGRPNAGKSTLINALVGEKISIVSRKAQTTRNKITGIMHGEDYQAIFIDTPGIHNGKNKLSDFMKSSIDMALKDVDIVLYLLAADKKINDTDNVYLQRFTNSKTPVLLVVNKCDLAPPPLLDTSVPVIPVSALKGKGIEVLKQEIVKRLPEGERYYPEDMLTDKSGVFMAGEIIREKALQYLSDEIPYGVGVYVEKHERTGELLRLNAVIVCEKAAHKGIIIGKGGAALKRISTAARKEMEQVFGGKVYLEVFVKVKENWRDNPGALNELGYGRRDL